MKKFKKPVWNIPGDFGMGNYNTPTAFVHHS
jgi:hypothetical protein